VLADLVLRPWDDSRPAVTARLTVSAALASLRGDADRTGEVDGLPITVAHVRELLRRLGALGVRAPEGGTLTLAVTDGNGGLLATAGPGQLERLARRGCPTHREVDCGCPVLDRPPPTGSYRPTDAQRVWVRTRDGGCRFPNCGQRVGWADLDHVVPHACGGETACVNLCCLCRSHHRLKTFARGWRFTMAGDGTLAVTTPSGTTRTTRPPGTGVGAAGPPGAPEAATGSPDDDLPPF
jgi:hypothetical protein